MAKTFKNLLGEIVEIKEFDTSSIETKKDVITGEVSNYFVLTNDYRHEVDEKTYLEVKTHLDKGFRKIEE